MKTPFVYTDFEICSFQIFTSYFVMGNIKNNDGLYFLTFYKRNNPSKHKIFTSHKSLIDGPLFNKLNNV